MSKEIAAVGFSTTFLVLMRLVWVPPDDRDKAVISRHVARVLDRFSATVSGRSWRHTSESRKRER
jgi:hypothetical protein